MVMYLKAEEYRFSSKASTSTSSLLYLFESNQSEPGELYSDVDLGAKISGAGHDGKSQFIPSDLSGQHNPRNGTSFNHSSLGRNTVANCIILSSATSVCSPDYQSRLDVENSHDGFTSQQLVDRLLSSVLSTKGLKYIRTFLALYRFFLPPSDLFEAFAQAFHCVSCSGRYDVINAIDQLRYLNILEMWVKGYPGDFALFPTNSKAKIFIEQVKRFRILSIAANELSLRVINVTEDDNTYWALNDGCKSTDIKLQRMEVGASRKPINGDLMHSNAKTNYDLLYTRNDPSKIRWRTEAALSCTGAHQETYYEKPHTTQSLIPDQQSDFTKIQWRQLISENDESIAREMTRIDWILFSSFSPRDLIRHVTLAADAKRFCQRLGNVDRMVNHFNHIAYWVTNIILVRDKAKHRAMMMMKLMRVARVSFWAMA